MPKPKMFVCNKIKWKRYGTNIYIWYPTAYLNVCPLSYPSGDLLSSKSNPAKSRTKDQISQSVVGCLFFWGGGGVFTMYIQKSTCFSSPCMVGPYTVFVCSHLVHEHNHNQVIAWLWLCLCAEFWQWFHCTYFSYHWCKICNFVHRLTQITQSAWPLIHWNQETTAG